jgi:hypothetical protein
MKIDMSETADKTVGPEEPRKRTHAILFIAGEERNSIAARANLAKICKSAPQGSVEFEIVDVLVDYRKALQFKVLLTPALLIFAADRSARITGSLDQSNRVAAALGLSAVGA